MTAYFDHHATTPCADEVVAAMAPHWQEQFGNAASRGHRLGIEARRATEGARSQVAAFLGASPKEIVFTSGATESNNLAILGVARAAVRSGRSAHVVTVATEHKAVLDPVAHLMKEGVATTVLPVDGLGRVDPDAIADAIRPDTVLVSVMAVNNEIGVVQDLDAIAAVCRERGVVFHSDGAQAGWSGIDVRSTPVDLVSLSAHKLYGPKGVGALYVRRRRPAVTIEPLLFGGGHERGLRSGTLPVPLIVGMGTACALVAAERPVQQARLAGLRDRLWSRLDALGGVTRNGDPTRCAPHNLNVSIEGVEAQALLLAVRDVVALSTGSACSSATLERSHVLVALGLSDEAVASSVRIGLGRGTRDGDVEAVGDALVDKIVELRALAHLYE
jgi:cysteine desulfurase